MRGVDSPTSHRMQRGKPYEPTDPTQASQAATALTSLPSLEDTNTQTETAIVQLGHQITAIAPTVLWDWRREDSRGGGCTPPFEQSGGVRG